MIAEKFFIIETNCGQGVQSGVYQLIPFAQIFQIKFPGIAGGLIWNRPTSYLLINPNGSEDVLRIPDITRQIILILFGCAFMFVLLFKGIVFISDRRRRSCG